MSERRKSETIIATFHSQLYKPLADITLPRLKYYAAKHKYDLYIEEYEDSIEVIGWERFQRVYHFLGEYRRVMWCDADALITNPQSRLEDFGGPIVMSADLHGPNTGVFIAHNDNLVRQLFFAITGQYGHEHFGKHPWGEQAAFIHLTAMPPYNKLVCWVDQEQFNAYPNSDNHMPEFVQGQWRFGDFLIQFAGLPLTRRIDLAKKYAKATEQLFP